MEVVVGDCAGVPLLAMPVCLGLARSPLGARLAAFVFATD